MEQIDGHVFQVFISNNLADSWGFLTMYLSSKWSWLLLLLSPEGRWLRWPLSQHMGRSLLKDGDPRSSLSSPGLPGEGCGCWNLGLPLRQKTLQCWMFHGDLWDVFCCRPPHVGHIHGCALCGFCSTSRWLARCICHQRVAFINERIHCSSINLKCQAEAKNSGCMLVAHFHWVYNLVCLKDVCCSPNHLKAAETSCPHTNTSLWKFALKAFCQKACIIRTHKVDCM